MIVGKILINCVGISFNGKPAQEYHLLMNFEDDVIYNNKLFKNRYYSCLTLK